jgi:integral membrane protein
MIRSTTRHDDTAIGRDRGLLLRYRVMAYTTATLLIVLVFVGLPLQFVAGRPGVVNVVGTLHGFLYLIYLFVAFQLTRRLGIPKWQMLLVLLAGTVPFCAFVAERKLTRRFESIGLQSPHPGAPKSSRSLAAIRRRWLSPRALLLHLEVAIVAPACLAAGWWQVRTALAGNSLSWVYTVEWPIFALIAIGAWWFLIHEDPEAYRARKQRSPSDGTAEALALEAEREVTVEAANARMAKTLALLTGLELVLGIVALVFVPASRPSGWLPVKGASVYLPHAILGLPLAFGAVGLLARVRGSARLSRLSGWIGLVGVAIAGAGGLLTVAHSLRIAGLAFMLIGTVVAGFGYLIPTFEKLS